MSGKFLCVCPMCDNLCDNFAESPLRWMVAKATGRICDDCLKKNYDAIYSEIKTISEAVLKKIKNKTKER